MSASSARLPERDRRIGAIDEPNFGIGRLGASSSRPAGFSGTARRAASDRAPGSSRRCGRRSAPACDAGCASSGSLSQEFWPVGLKYCTMKPSSPGFTLRWRLSCGRLRRTVVPSVPPGFSSAPTSAARTVRAQQHSKAPQPLLTDLPSVTATGRSGSVSPSISIVAPMLAASRYSPAMRRIVAAGTSQIFSAHSGV